MCVSALLSTPIGYIGYLTTYLGLSLVILFCSLSFRTSFCPHLIQIYDLPHIFQHGHWPCGSASPTYSVWTDHSLPVAQLDLCSSCPILSSP